ncbi:MAG: PIN domain-containing protein [Deltaproteobacteria bacterium]|nr:PIN domain-containing protein [Deltaproteobacteria bacterium]
MKDRYVLDSSIWIEMERRNSRILDKITPLIERNEICLVDLIAAEVLRGTKTRKDFKALQKAFSDFPEISTRWEKVARLAFDVARRGFNPPLTDLYIAQAVREHGKTLITQDSDFLQISRVKPFSLEFLAGS